MLIWGSRIKRPGGADNTNPGLTKEVPLALSHATAHVTIRTPNRPSPPTWTWRAS